MRTRLQVGREPSSHLPSASTRGGEPAGHPRLIGHQSHRMTSPNPDHFPKALPPDTITSQAGMSACEFGGQWSQPEACTAAGAGALGESTIQESHLLPWREQSAEQRARLLAGPPSFLGPSGRFPNSPPAWKQPGSPHRSLGG